MNEIINSHIPEMSPSNARYGELANVNKLLKRAVDRHANNNIIPLRALIQIVRGDVQGFATGISTWALDHPTFKMYIAQRMARAAKGKNPSPAAVNAAVESIRAELVQRHQTVLDSEAVTAPSQSNMGDTIPGGYQQTYGWEGKPQAAASLENPEVLPPKSQVTNLGDALRPNDYQPNVGWEGKTLPQIVANPEVLPGRQSSDMPSLSGMGGRIVPQVEAMTKRIPQGYNPEVMVGRESQLGDRIPGPSDTATQPIVTSLKNLKPQEPVPTTWREFTAAKMGQYMKEEGSHGAAMKRMGEEWQKLKQGK